MIDIDSMDGKTIPINIRIPSNLVREIEYNIETYGFHSTRPDFIVDSMRILLKKILVSQIESIDDAETQEDQYINLGVLKLSIVELRTRYYRFNGKSIQIMLRIPPGLHQSVTCNYCKYVPFDDLNDFIRVAIIAGLDYYKDLFAMKDPEKYLKQEEAESKDNRMKLIELLQKGSSNYDLMDYFIKNFSKELL